MTPLGKRLRQDISQNGPISLADFMARCLLDPEHGYYTTRIPIGRSGDFTTAPEISQMFGELVGLSLAQAWMDQGAPLAAALFEMGPGRGTLMADILRSTRRVPGFHDAQGVHLLEASPRLREVQKETLGNHPVTFVNALDALPTAPLFAVANEFFDALPIRQFQRAAGGWRERQIGLEGENLALGLSAPAPISLLEHRLEDTRDGDIVEVCPQLSGIVSEIGGRIAQHGGAALIFDYGGWRSLGDTFQAVAKHEPVSPLETPGEADLTAHVDFEAIARAAKAVPGLAVTAMAPQGVWLERLGITARAQQLAKGLSGAPLESHVTAHRRLTHPEEMGTVFKVIALTPAAAPTFPGFAP